MQNQTPADSGNDTQKARDRWPALYCGLDQIPSNLLEENLLPLLEDPSSNLIFSGSVASHKTGEYRPMVGAAPLELRNRLMSGRSLIKEMTSLCGPGFKCMPTVITGCGRQTNYVGDLRDAGRSGTLAVVKEILKDRKALNEAAAS